MRKIQTNCTSCGVLKTEENTYTNGTLKNGKPKLMSKCKKCYTKERVAYQKKNRDKIRARYVSKRTTPKRAKWVQSLMAGINKRTNPKTSKSARPIEKGEGVTVLYLMELFDKQSGKCYYTGVELNQKGFRLSKASVDRVDSNKGYVKGNIVLCCMGINFMKSTETPQNLYKLLNQIKSVEV